MFSSVGRRDLLLALVLAGCAAPSSPPARMEAANSLAAAESAFAAHSVREGMRAAFMASFAADGVFVRDGWTIANAFLAPRPDPPILLDWKPAYVEVSASGELGLSTGPWRLEARAKPQEPPAYGQFVSIWRREGAGPWKVAVDLGISHPGPALWDRPLETAAPPGFAAGAGGGIAQAEERFAAEALRNGARAAYALHASERLRFYREGAPPALGRSAALAAQAIPDADILWIAERTETARSGDFGYARGHYAAVGAPGVALGYFMRVWRLEGDRWRIALDVTNPARR